MQFKIVIDSYLQTRKMQVLIIFWVVLTKNWVKQIKELKNSQQFYSYTQIMLMLFSQGLLVKTEKETFSKLLRITTQLCNWMGKNKIKLPIINQKKENLCFLNKIVIKKKKVTLSIMIHSKVITYIIKISNLLIMKKTSLIRLSLK